MSGPAVCAGRSLRMAGAAKSVMTLEEGFGWESVATCARRGFGADVVYVMGHVPEPPDEGWHYRVDDVHLINMPADEDGIACGPWRGLAPWDLLRAFEMFERLVGVSWGTSIGQTVEHLIRSTHPAARGGRALDRSEAAVPPPCEDRTLEQPFYRWERGLTADERAAGWVHRFDQRAQYLAAWGTVEVGHGAALHQVRPRFSGRQAGVWRIPQMPETLEPLLPAPWIGEREWYTTPTIVRMLETVPGMDVPDIAEAWVWPQSSRYFRSAAERLNRARLRCEEEAAAAGRHLRAAESREEISEALTRGVVSSAVLEAVKAMYQRSHGRLMAGWRTAESGFARPDWAAFIMAQARVNLHRRIEKLGRYPFAISVDELAFATDEPDPVKFAEQIRLPLGAGLGQFKHTTTEQRGTE